MKFTTQILIFSKTQTLIYIFYNELKSTKSNKYYTWLKAKTSMQTESVKNSMHNEQKVQKLACFH